jgi:hypothetical protein
MFTNLPQNSSATDYIHLTHLYRFPLALYASAGEVSNSLVSSSLLRLSSQRSCQRDEGRRSVTLDRVIVWQLAPDL